MDSRREKIAILGIRRSPDLMYFIKGGDVWAMPRKKPGEPRGRAERIAEVGIDIDLETYLYFVDVDGDISRVRRDVAAPPTSRKPPTRSTRISSPTGRGERRSSGEAAREP